MNRKAFTLIELMVSMAIIGILIGLTIFGIGVVQQGQRDAERKNKLKEINMLVQKYMDAFMVGPSDVYITTTATTLYVGATGCAAISSSCYLVQVPAHLRPIAGASNINRTRYMDQAALGSTSLSTLNCTVGTGYIVRIDLEGSINYDLGSCK